MSFAFLPARAGLASGACAMLKQVVPFRSFFGHEEGSILQIFALSIVVVCGMIGLAIDGGRAMSASNKASASLDAAALAATRALIQTGANDAELLEVARKYFEENTKQGAGLLAQYENVQLEVDRATKTVRVSADVKVKTTFSNVIGYNAFNFSTDATASFNVKDIELGVALDVTGSMNSYGKIAALRLASADLVNTLIPDSGAINEVSIGIAPYSGAIRLPESLAKAASNDISSDCVVERTSADRYSDAAPSPTSAFVFPTHGLKDFDPEDGKGSYNLTDDDRAKSCPAIEARGLTNDKPVLLDLIASLTASGPTSGHIGGQWAWNIVSPNWSGLWPDSLEAKAYDTRPMAERELVKAVIFMTDGVFNTAYGNKPVSSADQAKNLCQAMKDKTVIVYTVFFRDPTTPLTHPTLLECASEDETTGSKLFYTADNADELKTVFRNIAINLTNLRLSQ
jgi:Flp pilus assembly protein TadG